ATSSLGYIDWYLQSDLNGQTAVTTVAVNQATANGLVCLTAAGNLGNDTDPTTSTIMAPADAFDVIACGAVDANGSVASFSSSGPTADGRVKPELLARGVGTATVNSTNTTGISGVSGTSLSTPLLAGAVTCVLQARPSFGVAQMRQALFATASRTAAGLGTDPLFVQGYGLARSLPAAMHGLAPADLNLDGVVNGADLGILFGEWGSAAPTAGDLNGDGTVSGADLGILLTQWS
ncbi:MAG: S8 family serine peptidase, partial [Phycisphaerae bacterium]|nr:S8 family serine peptidase [Phycisphaerae bacterium]